MLGIEPPFLKLVVCLLWVEVDKFIGWGSFLC